MRTGALDTCLQEPVDGLLRDWHAHDVNQSAVALTSRDGFIHVGGHYTVIPAAP